MEKFNVTRYRDGQIIGRVELTESQFAHWQALAQQPEGIIRLGDLPHDLYNLDPEHQDAEPDTVVYLD